MQTDRADVAFVRLDDTLTLETLEATRSQLAPALERACDVVLDVRSSGMDSSGLGAILSAQRRLELKGHRLLVVAAPELNDLLNRIGVPGALSVFRDSTSALAYIDGADDRVEA